MSLCARQNSKLASMTFTSGVTLMVILLTGFLGGRGAGEPGSKDKAKATLERLGVKTVYTYKK